MFEDVDDAGLIDAMAAGAAAESIAAARRLSAIAELVTRHRDGPPGSARWSCDNWDMLAAQVAAAHHISHAKASAQMYLACALRHRLPRVQALLGAGTITVGLASTIVWHTDLIEDPAILARLDTALAADATRYGPLSAAKTATAIDTLITRHDPAAARRTRTAMRGRDVIITPATNNTGTATIWGTLSAIDAALLKRRLEAMARDVCGADPAPWANAAPMPSAPWPPTANTWPAPATTPTAPTASAPTPAPPPWSSTSSPTTPAWPPTPTPCTTANSHRSPPTSAQRQTLNPNPSPDTTPPTSRAATPCPPPCWPNSSLPAPPKPPSTPSPTPHPNLATALRPPCNASSAPAT